MMRDGRIRYFAPADYTDGKELDGLVKSIIDRTVANETLENMHYKYKKEQILADKNTNEEERRKIDLLIALENSHSFANTHTIISELQEIDDWTSDEKNILFNIGINNDQVRYILHDVDITAFYKTILKRTKALNKDARQIKEILEEDN